MQKKIGEKESVSPAQKLDYKQVFRKLPPFEKSKPNPQKFNYQSFCTLKFGNKSSEKYSTSRLFDNLSKKMANEKNNSPFLTRKIADFSSKSPFLTNYLKENPKKTPFKVIKCETIYENNDDSNIFHQKIEDSSKVSKSIFRNIKQKYNFGVSSEKIPSSFPQNYKSSENLWRKMSEKLKILKTNFIGQKSSRTNSLISCKTDRKPIISPIKQLFREKSSKLINSKALKNPLKEKFSIPKSENQPKTLKIDPKNVQTSKTDQSLIFKSVDLEQFILYIKNLFKLCEKLQKKEAFINEFVVYFQYSQRINFDIFLTSNFSNDHHLSLKLEKIGLWILIGMLLILPKYQTEINLCQKIISRITANFLHFFKFVHENTKQAF